MAQMTSSVSSTRLSGLSACFLKLSNEKALEKGTTDPVSVPDGKVVGSLVAAPEAQGRSALLCPVAGPRWSGGPSAMERTVHVSHDHLMKQLSTVSTSRSSDASLPGGKATFCYFLAVPSWATSEPLF